MSEEKQNTEEREIVERLSYDYIEKYDLSSIVKGIQSEIRSREILKNYKRSDVKEMVENSGVPANQRKLREIARTLYMSSTQFKRLIKYLAGLPLFAHYLAPKENISIESKYSKTFILEKLEEAASMTQRMNIKHEFKKILQSTLIEDVFYGYIHDTGRNFYIQKIESDICAITSIQDGLFVYSIDMSVFLQNPDELIYYPSEFAVMYKKWLRKYKNNSAISTYVEIPLSKSICIKFDETNTSPCPPFMGVFEDIFNIKSYKELRNDKEEIGNYKLVTHKLPIRTDSDNNNDFLIDYTTMRYYHNSVAEALPDNVGLATSPMDLDVISFNQDKIDNDGVGKAERDFWSGIGTSQVLFNSEKPTAKGLELSIYTDEQLIFDVLTQMSRWLNHYLESNISENLFSVKILEATTFNKKQVIADLAQLGQYGFPVRSQLLSMMGLSPMESYNMAYLENEILQLDDHFKPFQSSHVMSGSEESGRPELEDEDLTEAGSTSRDYE